MSQVLNVSNLIEPDQSAAVMAAAAAPSSLVLDIVNEIQDFTGEIINSVASQQSSAASQPATSAQTSVIQENISAAGSGSAAPKRTLDNKNDKAIKRAKNSVSASFVVNLDYKTDKLETRLHDILCCKVCLDLPISSIFQCSNGHLMCAGCFTHILADARIRDETATCPNCRCVITKESCTRNSAVENAIGELPGECQYCNKELPRSQMERHISDVCEERIVMCRYSIIGCPWKGPFHESELHAQNCSHPNKSGKQVMKYCEERNKAMSEERKLFDRLHALLSFEKITFHDLHFRPFRTDEYIHKLFYESTRFTAFNVQWVVKARDFDDQRDPTQNCERRLGFQLVLKTAKVSPPMNIHYMILKGPFGDMKTTPKLYRHEFSETSLESPHQKIQLTSSEECNRLLASKIINFRLIMFQQATK